MLFIFPKIVNSAAIGIDLGSDVITYSVASADQPLHAAINLLSKRYFPHTFAFWNREKPSDRESTNKWTNDTITQFDWAFGQQAFDHCTRFPKNCVYGNVLKPELFSNLTGIEITSLSLLQSLSSVLMAEQINEKYTAVVAIPPKLTPREKSYLYTACKIAGLDAVQFVDITNAPAQLYALERKNKFENSKKNVAFVDIGYSGVRVSIFSFDGRYDQPIIEQLAVQSDEENGGQSLDTLLASKIAKDNRIQLDSLKVKNSFTREIRKAKELLTLHPTTMIKWEDEDSGDMKVITVSRSDLEFVSKQLNASLHNLVEKALQEANLQSVDFVEIIGGGTRMIWVQEELPKLFGVHKVSRSMNADHAVVMGAGYIAAEHAPEFHVAPVQRSLLLTSFSYVKLNGKRYRIFTPGDQEDSNPEFDVDLTSQDLISIYDENDQEYLRFTIADLPLETPTTVTLSFIHNFFLMPIPYKATDSNGKEYTQFDYQNIGWEVSPSEVNSMTEVVRTLIEMTNKRRVVEKAVNDYEAYLLHINDLAETKKKSLTDNEYSTISNLYFDEMKWLENNLKGSDERVYKARLSSAMKTIDPIIARLDSTVEKPLMLEKLQKTLSKSKELISQSQFQNIEQEPVEELEYFIRYVTEWIEEYNINPESHSKEEIMNQRQELKKKMVQVKQLIRAASKIAGAI